jgi:hypothetical protein
MRTTPELFASRLTATQADVERAKTLLNRDGLIPVEDEPGHRGALELWRRHCQRAESSRPSMLAAVHTLLELPRCTFDGLRETTRLAWVRLADIPITTSANFTYHFTVEGLAQLASNLITEQADPESLARILGDYYIVETVAAPHGLLHEVARTATTGLWPLRRPASRWLW